MGVPADPTCSGRGAGYSLLRWRRVGVCRASHQPEVMPRGQGDPGSGVCVCEVSKLAAVVVSRTGDGQGGRYFLFDSFRQRTHAHPQGRQPAGRGVRGRTQTATNVSRRGTQQRAHKQTRWRKNRAKRHAEEAGGSTGGSQVRNPVPLRRGNARGGRGRVVRLGEGMRGRSKPRAHTAHPAHARAGRGTDLLLAAALRTWAEQTKRLIREGPKKHAVQRRIVVAGFARTFGRLANEK